MLEFKTKKDFFGIPAELGGCQLGDLITLVEPRGLKAAAVVRPATPGLAEDGLSDFSGMLRVEVTPGVNC